MQGRTRTHTSSSVGSTIVPAPVAYAASMARTKRRPLLADLRQNAVVSLDQLEPFLSRVSLASYEAVYATLGAAAVDSDALEACLDADMFSFDAA